MLFSLVRIPMRMLVCSPVKVGLGSAQGIFAEFFGKEVSLGQNKFCRVFGLRQK